MLSAKFSRKQLQVIRYFVIQSIIAQRGREEGWVATACYQNIVLIRDLKSTSCTWCLPGSWSIWICTWKYEKTNKLVLKSIKYFEKLLPRLCLQLISSPQIVFDTNIPSNITYQIPNDLLCVFNFTSYLSVFLPSPGCQIYVSTFYHKRYGYR